MLGDNNTANTLPQIPDHRLSQSVFGYWFWEKCPAVRFFTAK
jgi:hypothetical protein